MKEELTTKMHAELTSSEQAQRKFTIATARQAVRYGVMNEQEAMDAYGVSKEELERGE